MIVKDSKGKIAKLSGGGDARYLLSVDAVLSVGPGDKMKAGDVLARIPLESAKNRDITGGLQGYLDSTIIGGFVTDASHITGCKCHCHRHDHQGNNQP